MWQVTDLQNAVEQLKDNGVILCPTDTVWGLSCLASSESGIEKLNQIKNRPDYKAYIVLFSDIEQAQKHFPPFPESILTLLRESTSPTTVILYNAQNISDKVMANDKSLAFRIVQNNFIAEVIKALNHPIVSTSANLSGKPSPKLFQEIENPIKLQVDYVVKWQQEEKTFNAPSRIVKWDGTQLITIRA